MRERKIAALILVTIGLVVLPLWGPSTGKAPQGREQRITLDSLPYQEHRTEYGMIVEVMSLGVPTFVARYAPNGQMVCLASWVRRAECGGR